MSALPVPSDPDHRATDRTLFDLLPVAALVLDPDERRVVDANRQAMELYGFTAQAFVGKPLARLSADASAELDHLRRAAGDDAVHRYETTHHRRDGSAARLEVSATRIAHAGRPAVLCVCRTATPAPPDDRARQVAKMEAVGQLAGGVAHDFNNLLTVINGYADLLADTLPPGSPAGEAVTEIAAAGRRAADLTRQLLAFSRKQVLHPRVIELGDLLANLRKLLVRVIGEDVRLVTTISQTRAKVKADPGQVEQVVLNLAVNARDAMPRGGTLTIEVRDVREEADPFVELSVSDTGCGMTDEVKARIFEPFFTTKGPGKGTGLGLATVLGIVEQSGGRIEVASRPGVGTTFRVRFPAVGGVVLSGERPANPGSFPGGSETVLLVEDEPAVRMLALHALQSSGYAVLDAENGEQALRVVNTYKVPISLLVTDVVMPGINGRELAEQMAVVNPDLRVLFMSGYTDDAVFRHGVATDRVNFLPKPFTPSVLTRKVREVLDAPTAVAVG